MKRIVFCPYLSAMWASMAPLYAEHVAAGDEVTVMSLPYAGRDHSGNVLEYHTDTGYPVPQTVASIHVLKEMHPDIIYFHNPYDNINIITQVQPIFHSKHLRGCTDDLIYVPYYTMPMSPGGDVRHIIEAPGVRRANHIVVYSQASAKTYMSVLNADKECIIIKQRPEPRTDYEMPYEWQRISRGRRLVMLGTSVGALMDNKVEELAKICNVIGKYQHEDACLLWRPHPLYDATLTALLPKLQKTYRGIVNNFVEYQLGILDTSWDLERAVTLCTEYIGDPSSLVGFFNEQGKPVQII